MGLRETINSSKIASTIVAVVLMVVAAAVATVHFMPRKQVKITQAYYTDDEGATYFPDSVYRVPPFDHDGKTAVRAMVMSYGDGKKAYVAYLQEFTPTAKKKLDAACAAAQAAGQPLSSVKEFYDVDIFNSGIEVKAPGAGHKWIARRSHDAMDVMNLPTPDDSPRVEQVLP